MCVPARCVCTSGDVHVNRKREEEVLYISALHFTDVCTFALLAVVAVLLSCFVQFPLQPENTPSHDQ